MTDDMDPPPPQPDEASASRVLLKPASKTVRRASSQSNSSPHKRSASGMVQRASSLMVSSTSSSSKNTTAASNPDQSSSSLRPINPPLRSGADSSLRSHSRSSSVAVSPTPSLFKAPSRSSTVPDMSASIAQAQASAAAATVPAGSGSSSLANSGILVGAQKSVEETVKTFRIYEALRNGDTGAITKALREAMGGEDNRRVSMSTMGGVDINRSQILHLAVQCAEMPVIEYILATTTSEPDSTTRPYLDLNHRDPKDGNTPLHIAAQLGRADVVHLLLKQPGINDSVHNYNNRTPLEAARTPAIYHELQMARSLFMDEQIGKMHRYVAEEKYQELQDLLETPRAKGLVDLNAIEPAVPYGTGSTLLHEAARKKDTKLIQLLLMHGADPFRRDKKGKLPQDVTKDEKTRAVLKRSPAAVAAARGIEEKAVLGNSVDRPAGLEGSLGGKESREMKGYLKKWTNYTGGYKLRWFVLEDGVLSYYKNQDDIGSACRGALNMRIGTLHMDPQDKCRFEIRGKGSVKFHLKANHVIEAKRWFWTLNNAIQFAKDEAREEERQAKRDTEKLAQAKERARHEDDGEASGTDMERRQSKAVSLAGSENLNVKRISLKPSGSSMGGEDYDHSDRSFNERSEMGGYEGAEQEEDFADDSSSNIQEPPSADALALTANSARLQLDLLSQVVLALQFEQQSNPDLMLRDPEVVSAMTSYDSAVNSLKQLVGALVNMSKERDSYWRSRLEQEVSLRRLWEENMTRIAQEQEQLEGRVEDERERRKRAKKALKQVKQGLIKDGRSGTEHREHIHDAREGVEELEARLQELEESQPVDKIVDLSEDESDDSDEFFDAIDAGQVEVMTEMPISVKSPAVFEEPEEENEKQLVLGPRDAKVYAIKSSFIGYEDPPRERLKMDADDRPKISLWGILKSMIGKDMTKMTLPVSFNEPTSLLQRVAEDMEYTDLLDFAADRVDSAERMVYVAAFAASEYASTIDRIAKPFNPLLGETYEYCRPDKGYRFFIEQVSHHPPIGAAFAESPKWDYWGESAVKSIFRGKSFDINPLGTWFLRLRPASGGEELYTWKKVTSSVVGIILGNPTVDNYGVMEIKNWTTGETCTLDFKARGWSVKSAYEVKGRVAEPDGTVAWNVNGRWNDKIYARLAPGYEGMQSPPPTNTEGSVRSGHLGAGAAVQVWQCHYRPTGIPFNLTPFVVTLNALTPTLSEVVCPTDTRLRPDQRAMEDGEYDLAATEKNRLEEKQRAKRRDREISGVPYQPRWFRKNVEEVTGEEYWEFIGDESGEGYAYWATRARFAKGEGEWGVEDIF